MKKQTRMTHLFKLGGLLTLALLLITSNVLAQTAIVPGANGGDGPGGVGITDGSSSLELWLRGDRGLTLDGSNVSGWADQSGNTVDFAEVNLINPPTFVSNVQNNQPTVRFGDQQIMESLASSVEAPWKAYLVLNDTDTDYSAAPLTGPGQLRYEQFMNRGSMGFTTSGGSDWTSTVPTLFGSWVIVSWAQNADIMTFNNGTSNGTLPIPNSSAQLPLGRLSVYSGDDFEGDLSEVIAYSEDMPLVRQILIENYLSSKYDIAAATDVYDGDTNDNGDFDLDVAGIGQLGGNQHTQSHAAGMIVVDSSFLQDDGDWLLFGHNVATNDKVSTNIPTGGDWDTAPAPMHWTRHYYIDVTDDTATVDCSTPGTCYVDIIFDYSEGGMNSDLAKLPSGDVNNYRLLRRAGTTGLFDDIATATGIVGDQVQFLNVDVSLLGSNFTLGSLDDGNSPTAVSLQSIAPSTSNTAVPLLVVMMLAGVGTALLFIRRREQI